MSRGAILHDYLLVPGGAERLTLTLAQGLPQADLWVGSCTLPADIPRPQRLRDLGAGSRLTPWRILKTLRTFSVATRTLGDYDWVLYGGYYAPVAVHHHPRGRNVHYCHSVPRYAYDLRDHYLACCPAWRRPGLRALMDHVQRRYEAAVARMDLIVANSENVRARVRRYLGRDAVVIHPPCDLERFRWLGQGDYYLSSARLEPLKRVEVLVRAFRALPERRLVVASGGGELERLRRLAGDAPNIRFTGWLPEAGLQRLTGQAIATLYIPRDEDFGMSPVESMAAGKPVIGVAEGGLLETVVHGRTGLLLPPDPGPEQVIEAVRALDPARAGAMRAACQARARLFGREVFLERMRAALGLDPPGGRQGATAALD